MYDSIHLKGYRGFRDFSLPRVGRLNLIVGKNNTGKSSLLEAISALASGDPARLFGPLLTRGERLRETRESPRRETLLDVRRLFAGHELKLGQHLEIKGLGDTLPTFMSASVEELEPDAESGSTMDLFDDEDELGQGRLALEIEVAGYIRRLPLSPEGGLSLQHARQLLATASPGPAFGPVQLVSTESLSAERVSMLWADIALTEDEDRITEALRVLEPDIERIAFIGSDYRGPQLSRSKEGVVVKLRSSSQRVPIGSMGDGMWRMLCLALCAVRASEGVLLVDEIDTGLHYSVIENVWKLLLTTSRRMGLQVFATTHSLDCVLAIAALCEDEGFPGDILLHRIERGHDQPVTFVGQELVASARQGIEIR